LNPVDLNKNDVNSKRNEIRDWKEDNEP
jgi:hypothetical protein